MQSSKSQFVPNNETKNWVKPICSLKSKYSSTRLGMPFLKNFVELIENFRSPNAHSGAHILIQAFISPLGKPRGGWGGRDPTLSV